MRTLLPDESRRGLNSRGLQDKASVKDGQDERRSKSVCPECKSEKTRTLTHDLWTLQSRSVIFVVSHYENI